MFLIQNLIFKSCFQIRAELSYVLIISKNKLLENDNLGQKAFYEFVACFCLTFGTTFLLIAFLTAIGFLMSVMTISFALPIDLNKSLSLEFKKWLVYKDFDLKENKSLVLLPCPSRNLQFLAVLIPM